MSWAIQRDDQLLVVRESRRRLRGMGVMRLCMSPLGWAGCNFDITAPGLRVQYSHRRPIVVPVRMRYKGPSSSAAAITIHVPEDAKARCITLLLSHHPRQSAGQAAEHHRICACSCAICNIFHHAIECQVQLASSILQISFASGGRSRYETLSLRQEDAG